MLGGAGRRLLENSRVRRLLFALILLPVNGIYMLNNQWVINHERAVVWQWAIDDYIPLWPVFVIPYIYWYFQILTTAAWFILSNRRPALLYKFVLAISISALLANLFFIALPTHVPRPDLAADDIFSRLLQIIYTIDEPYNCFPSLHVTFACIVAWFWHVGGPRHLAFRLFNWFSWLLVVASTVFTKQHYLPDIPGGLILAAIGLFLTERLWRWHSSRSHKRRADAGQKRQPS